MGVTSGLCGVDEFHDDVSGLCGRCSDICRDIAKPDSSCIYHCPDYYSRLLSTTAVSLQQELPITLLVLIPLLVLVIIGMMVIIIVMTCRYRKLHTQIHKRKRYTFPGRRNNETEFTVSRFRHRRRNRHNSVQETRDPNKQEDMQLSVLCVSACSSLVLGTESATDGIRFQSLAHDMNPLNRNRGGSKHHIKTHAIVSAEDVPFCSELEETELKIAGDIESRSSSSNNKRSGELVTKSRHFEETCTSETNQILPELDGEDVTKHFNIVQDSRLCFEHRERGNSETSSIPVQEICTFGRSKGVRSEQDDANLHGSFQESYSAISEGGPS